LLAFVAVADVVLAVPVMLAVPIVLLLLLLLLVDNDGRCTVGFGPLGGFCTNEPDPDLDIDATSSWPLVAVVALAFLVAFSSPSFCSVAFTCASKNLNSGIGEGTGSFP